MTGSAEAPPADDRPAVALVVHGVSEFGGMEQACTELIGRLHDRVRFVVVSVELREDLRPLVERWVPIRAPLHPMPVKFLAFAAQAGRVLRHLQVDLVHTVGAIVPNRVDVAGVHFCHAGHRAATGSLAPRDAPPLRRLNRTTARALALGAEHWCYRPSRLRSFAAVSDGVAGELAAHYPAVPCVVTPNGVDTARFAPDEEVRRAVRRREGIPADRAVAIFVGGDWGHKGLGPIISALAVARAKDADLALWVVGRGDVARFTRLARQGGVEGAVRFFGDRADTADLYRGADLFVMASIYETFSLVGLEAAASGLPLVVTPHSGVAATSLTPDDGGGRLVAREPSAIATALVELAGDAALRRALGLTARTRAQRFTWHESVEATFALYRSLLAERA